MLLEKLVSMVMAGVDRELELFNSKELFDKLVKLVKLFEKLVKFVKFVELFKSVKLVKLPF